MNSLEIVEFIAKKYNLDLTQKSPIKMPIGRYKDFPRLLKELGYKIGAEIGVYRGDYSRWLLRIIPGLKLYGIDLWESYPGYKDFGSHDIKEAYDVAVKNTTGYDCTLIKEWSDVAADRFEDESLDFVYIDGNHSYEWCVRDIAKWSAKVKVGGIVSGHDYDDYRSGKYVELIQVVPAVEGWVRTKHINPYFVITKNKGSSWFYVK